MNSLIFSAVTAFCSGFVNIFKSSIIYRIILKTSDCFSEWWKKSIIMTFLKKEHFFSAEENSILYKVICVPFNVVNAVGKKISERTADMWEHSVLINLARCFTNAALSLNTRFCGCILLAYLASNELVCLKFSLSSVILALFGMLLVAVNFNVTDFFEESKVVTFFTSAAGIDIFSREIYDKKYINTAALVMGTVCGCAMGLISVTSLLAAFALPFAFVGMCVVIACPVSGVFFAVFAAPFVPTMLLAGLCALTFLSAVLKAFRTKSFRLKLDGVGTGIGFFLIFMLVSCIFSFASAKSLMVWGMYLIFLGFYFVVINTVETKEQVYNILKVFVIAGAIVSIYGVCQYVFGWNTSNAWIDEEMFEEATMRAYSTMENPNVLGEYLLLIVPLSAAFMIKGAKFKEKAFYAIIFLLSALCMVFTQSRGCWLGLILAAAIFVTFYNGRLWGFLPIILLLLPFVIPSTMADRMMSVGNLEDSSTSYRVFIWLGTFRMLKDFWLGGIGMGEGAFRSVYPLYSYNAIVAPHSHNTYFQLLTEGGIAALIIFAVIMILFIKNISSVYSKNGKNTADGIIALAIGSGVIGFLLQSMFDYTFYNYRMMAMFFMIMAISGAMYKFTKKKGQDV